MQHDRQKAPGSAHFGFFIAWACLVTIGVLFLEGALSLSFESTWHLAKFFLPFLLLVGFGIYLRERQKEILRQLYRLSVTDSLTGAYNRQYLFDNLRKLINSGCAPISITFVDIDAFKAYNDRHGHALGDSVLKVMIYVLGRHIVRGEFVARYGGDEFVVVLRRDFTDSNEFVETAMREFSRDTTLSATAGIAQMSPGDDEDSLIKRADMNMYAKKGRR